MMSGGFSMERNDVYTTMINLADLIKEKKVLKLSTENSLNTTWEEYNKISFRLEYANWNDKENKMTLDERAFKIKFSKHNDGELQELMKSINVWNHQIKFLDIEIETLENKFKSMRTAYNLYM